MRKVSRLTGQAFIERRRLTVGNTTSTGDDLLLHGHAIAWHHHRGFIIISDAGFQTRTTQERLNALLSLLNVPAKIFQRDFKWFISIGDQTFAWASDAFVAGGSVHFTIEAAQDAAARVAS